MQGFVHGLQFEEIMYRPLISYSYKAKVHKTYIYVQLFNTSSSCTGLKKYLFLKIMKKN